MFKMHWFCIMTLQELSLHHYKKAFICLKSGLLCIIFFLYENVNILDWHPTKKYCKIIILWSIHFLSSLFLKQKKAKKKSNNILMFEFGPLNYNLYEEKNCYGHFMLIFIFCLHIYHLFHGHFLLLVALFIFLL